MPAAGAVVMRFVFIVIVMMVLVFVRVVVVLRPVVVIAMFAVFVRIVFVRVIMMIVRGFPGRRRRNGLRFHGGADWRRPWLLVVGRIGRLRGHFGIVLQIGAVLVVF